MNPNAFMFVNEPGFQFLFSAMSGCSDIKAKTDLAQNPTASFHINGIINNPNETPRPLK